MSAKPVLLVWLLVAKSALAGDPALRVHSRAKDCRKLAVKYNLSL